MKSYKVTESVTTFVSFIMRHDDEDRGYPGDYKYDGAENDEHSTQCPLWFRDVGRTTSQQRQGEVLHTESLLTVASAETVLVLSRSIEWHILLKSPTIAPLKPQSG